MRGRSGLNGRPRCPSARFAILPISRAIVLEEHAQHVNASVEPGDIGSTILAERLMVVKRILCASQIRWDVTSNLHDGDIDAFQNAVQSVFESALLSHL